MTGRVRMALATLRSAPWRRAPGLLRGRWGVLGSVVAAGAVLTASLAAVPLFLSSVGTASVALQAAERCPRDTGVSLPFAPTPSEITARPVDPLAPLAGALEPTNRWARIDDIFLEGADPTLGKRASLLTRDGALDHVEILDGAPGPGVWVSDRAVERMDLHVGDVVHLGDVDVPVTGVYRDLTGSTVDDYWCSNGDMVLVQSAAGELVPPPMLVLADDGTFADVLRQLHRPNTSGAWDAALAHDLTTAEAEALVEELACAPRAGEPLAWCRNGQPPLPRSLGRYDRTAQYATGSRQFVERYLGSHLPFVTLRSDAIRTSVAGGIGPIAGFGALAGLGLVAAAGSLWFDRRRRAVTLLSVRGVSPAGLGLKAVLELFSALLLSAVVGVLLADLAVIVLGPSTTLETAALRQAAVAGVACTLAAAVVIAVVVAWRSRPALRRRRRRVPVAALPWELALAWLTYVSYERLGEWGVPIGRGAEVTRVDLLGLLFPLLFLVTVVAVASRVLGWSARPLRELSRAWPIPLHLGIRRITRYRTALLGLVAAAAIAAGVLGYAGTMRRSLDATLAAKAATFVGSDVAVRLDADEPLPPDLAERSTIVDVYVNAYLGPDRDRVAVLALDPDTFARGAFWDPSFAKQSLDDLLAGLRRAPEAGRVPAVLVDAAIDPGETVTIQDEGGTEVALDSVATVRTFPGMKLVSPTVFVSREALAELGLSRTSHEVWIAGDRDEILASLETAGSGYVESRRAGTVIDGASFLTVRWTFGFMQSLGASAGLLALGGVAVYLDARRRDRVLGYAFMRRMGLQRRDHRRTLGVELSASVLVGTVLGVGTALVAAWLTHDQVDPVPRYQPDPLLRPATLAMVGLLVAATGVVVAGAGLAQRRVDRDDAVEVLRGGT